MTERIEMLLKAGALIAAFGYVSFRAHANYLGLWSNGDPSYTLCLTEGFPLFVKLLSVCIVVGIWSLLWTGATTLVVYVMDREPRRYEEVQRSMGRLAHKYSPYAILIAMAVLLWISARCAFHHDDRADGILAGDLYRCVLYKEIHHTSSFTCLAVAAIQGWTCVWVMSRNPNIFVIKSYSIKPLCIGVLLAQALYLAIIYGREVESCTFRVANIETDKSVHPEEVVLIDIGEAGVSVWNIDKTHVPPEGQLTIYKKDTVLLHVRKPVDIRQYAFDHL